MIYVVDIKKHDENKDALLDYFEMMQTTYNIKQDEYISFTDYFSHFNYHPPYEQLFHKTIGDELQTFCDSLDEQLTFHMQGCWVHQYETNNSFGWHTHEFCQFAAVYYLELPDDSEAAQFRPHIKVPPIKEGQLIIFPAWLPHRAPKNKSKNRNTVIT